MIYNPIQMMQEIAALNDRVASSRFLDVDYMRAINLSTDRIVEDRIDNIKDPKRYSFESVQTVRDQLFTLVPPTTTIVPSGNLIAYPNDYNYFLKLMCVIDGSAVVARATTFNESGVLYDNPFKRPTNIKPFFDQNSDGFFIYRNQDNSGTFSSALLDYIKNPSVVSIGKESDKIDSSGALVTSVKYIVYEEAVHNGVVYVEGDTFIAVNNILTSGIVIPYSVIVESDMPAKLQYEIITLASSIMNGNISDFSKKQLFQKDA